MQTQRRPSRETIRCPAVTQWPQASTDERRALRQRTRAATGPIVRCAGPGGRDRGWLEIQPAQSHADARTRPGACDRSSRFPRRSDSICAPGQHPAAGSAQNRHMPEPLLPAERKRAAREAERRRQAASALKITAAMCQYASVQVGNGMRPEEARDALVDLAGELARTAVLLRRLARLSARERAAQARRLAGLGMGTQEIATRLGVCAHTAWHYQHGRRSDGQPWAPS
jgi:hypothetical protein